MNRHLVVTNGEDPLTQPIVAYLRRKYNMDPKDIRRVQLDSEAGQPQTITVTLLIERPES